MRRLSQREIQSSVASAFPGLSLPPAELVADRRPHGYDNDLHALQLTDTFTQALHTYAVDVGRVVAENLGSALPCTTADPDCAREATRSLAERLFRRPADQLDVDDIAALYDGRPFDVGTALVVEAVIQSPEFIFRIELDAPRDDPVALANRLSFFLWGGPPDRELLDAARTGGLDSADGVRLEASRMLDDPRADVQLAAFVSMWLGLRPEGTTLGAESEAVVSESEDFAVHIVQSEGTLRDLFTSTEVRADPTVEAIYADDPSPEHRAGILSRAAFLAATSKVDDTSPVARGVTILERVLCTELGVPPADADATPLPDLGPGASRRERIEAQTEGDVVCAACHSRINPVGFALESFDRLGRFRQLDATGQPIDASGVLPSGATFADHRGLFEYIADAEASESCMTEQLLRFAFGGGPAAHDRALRDDVLSEFRARGRVIRELIPRDRHPPPVPTGALTNGN